MKHAPGPYKHEMVPTPGPDGQPAGYAVLIYPEAKVAAPEPGAEPVQMAVAVVTFFVDMEKTMANARLFERAPMLYDFLRYMAAHPGAWSNDIVPVLDYIDNGEVTNVPNEGVEVQGPTTPNGSAPPGA